MAQATAKVIADIRDKMQEANIQVLSGYFDDRDHGVTISKTRGNASVTGRIDTPVG